MHDNKINLNIYLFCSFSEGNQLFRDMNESVSQYLLIQCNTVNSYNYEKIIIYMTFVLKNLLLVYYPNPQFFSFRKNYV